MSWPRAALAAGLVVATVGGVWLVTQSGGVRAHPPRLPTEQEWRANQSAANAMEAPLSPALDAANRPETPRTP